jgi:hypothetical protein
VEEENMVEEGVKVERWGEKKSKEKIGGSGK